MKFECVKYIPLVSYEDGDLSLRLRGGSLLCFTCRFAENDPQKSWSGSNKSREVYFYGKKDFMKKYFPEIFFFSISESGGRRKSNIQKAQMVNGSKNGRFLGCFSTIHLPKTAFFAWLRSSHGVLSMIFGFLTKFRIDVGNFFPTNIFFEMKKNRDKHFLEKKSF